MKHYLTVYKTLLRLNLLNLIIYRGNFINEFASSIIWSFFSIVQVLLLTSRAPVVFGWTRVDMIILIGSWGVMWGIFHILFVRNFERFSFIIDHGQLDSILLKPVDSQFLISTWLTNYAAIFRFLIGAFIVWYTVTSYNIVVTASMVLGYVSLMIFGLLMIYSIWFSVTTLLIWLPRLSNLIELLFNVSGASRYPSDMFKKSQNVFYLLFIPFVIFIGTPTKVLINKIFLGDVILLLIFCFVFLVFSRWFWKFALRYYASAGS